VDDVALMCNALKRALHPAGLEVVTASNGREALRLARESDFDVVVTDLMMPEMSGEELIGHLSRLIPDLPCIILTGNATTQEVVRAAKLPNVAGVLVKPWNHERLLQTIAAAIRRKREPAKGATT
jgi:DNA-binding NtrC family response regulator